MLLKMSDLNVRVGAKALIKYKDKFLILREGASDGTATGKYQVPGGMVEPGEDFMDALLREVHEETGLSVKPIVPVMIDSWMPTIEGVPHQIFGIFYLCTTSTDKIKLSHEHDDYAWIKPSEVSKYITTLQIPKLIDQYEQFAGKMWGEP